MKIHNGGKMPLSWRDVQPYAVQSIDHVDLVGVQGYAEVQQAIHQFIDNVGAARLSDVGDVLREMVLISVCRACCPKCRPSLRVCPYGAVRVGDSVWAGYLCRNCWHSWDSWIPVTEGEGDDD